MRAGVLALLAAWLLLLWLYAQPQDARWQGRHLAEQVRGGHAAELLDGHLALFTTARTSLLLDRRSSGPALLTVEMNPPADLPQRAVTIRQAERAIATVPVQQGWRHYRLLLPGAPVMQPQWLHLSSSTTTFANDARYLGVALAALAVEPYQQPLPYPVDAGLLLAALLLGSLLFPRLKLPLAAGIVTSTVLLFGAIPALQPLVLTGIVAGLAALHGGLWVLPWLLPHRGAAEGGDGPSATAVAVLQAHWQHLAWGLAAATILVLGVVFAPPTAAVQVASQLLGLALFVLGVLCYAGFGLTWLLRSWRLGPLLPFYTPIVGLAGLIAAGHALGYLPWGTDQTALPLLAGCTLLNLLAWRQGARIRLTRPHGLAIAAGAVALLLGLWPIYQTGYLTTVGGSIDALSYVVRAEFRQVNGVLLLPPADLMVPPYMAHLRGQMAIREGDTFLLAFFSSLLQMRPHLLFSVMLAGWFALAATGVFVLAVTELRLKSGVAFAASLLAAVQPLLHSPVLNNGFSQSAGIAIWPFVLVAALQALRRPIGRTTILAGLLFSALATLYPPYLAYLGLIIGLVGLAEWVRHSRLRWAQLRVGAGRGVWLRAYGGGLLCFVRRGLALGAAALATIPFTWLLFINHLFYVAPLFGRTVLNPRGDIRVFPHFGEVIGLINHIAAAHNRPLPQVPDALATGLLVPTLALLLYGAGRSRGRRRWTVLALVAVLSGAMVHLRFWIAFGNGDAYLFYKVVALASPLYVLLVIYGLGLLTRHLHQDAGDLVRKRLAPGVSGALLVLVGAIGGIGLFHSAASAHYIGNGGSVIAFAERLELEQLPHYLPPDEPLLIADLTNPGQVWVTYLLHRPQLYYRQPSKSYWAPTQSYSPQLIRYILIAFPDRMWPWEKLELEPWFDPATSATVWENDAYRLLRRTDIVVAEFPLVLDGLAPVLDAPVEVAVTDGAVRMRNVSLPNGGFGQQLAGTPARLVLLVESTHGGMLLVEQIGEQAGGSGRPNRPQAYRVAAGRQRLTLPLEGPLTLRLQQQAGSELRLLAVQLAGQPD